MFAVGDTYYLELGANDDFKKLADTEFEKCQWRDAKDALVPPDKWIQQVFNRLLRHDREQD